MNEYRYGHRHCIGSLITFSSDSDTGESFIHRADLPVDGDFLACLDGDLALCGHAIHKHQQIMWDLQIDHDGGFVIQIIMHVGGEGQLVTFDHKTRGLQTHQ